MKIKTVFFVTILMFLSTYCRAQKATVLNPQKDSVKIKDKDEQLLNYIQEVNLDSENHRNFVKSLYIILFIGLGLVVNILGFFGFKTYKDIISKKNILIDTINQSQSKIDDELKKIAFNGTESEKKFKDEEENLKKLKDDIKLKSSNIEVSFEEKKEKLKKLESDLKLRKQEIDYISEQFETYQQKFKQIYNIIVNLDNKVDETNVRVDKVQDGVENISDQQDIPINIEQNDKGNYDSLIIKNGETIIEYKSLDRNDVIIRRKELLKFNYDKSIKTYSWSEKVSFDGEIYNYKGTPDTISFERTENEKNKCTFSLPLQGTNQLDIEYSLDIKDGFNGDTEYYILSQRTKWENEKFLLKFLKNMGVVDVSCETRNHNNKYEAIPMKLNKEFSKTHEIYSISLPNGNPPTDYKISWKF